MLATKSPSTGSVSFTGLLFLLFLALKLCGVISWSWWWITCPLWFGLAILALMVIVPLALGAIAVGFGVLVWLFAKVVQWFLKLRD